MSQPKWSTAMCRLTIYFMVKYRLFERLALYFWRRFMVRKQPNPRRLRRKVRVANMLTVKQTVFNAMVSHIVTQLGNAQLRLFTNNIEPDPNGLIAQFVEPTTNGYAEGDELPLIGPMVFPDGSSGYLIQQNVWIGDGTGDPVDIVGWFATWETDSTGWMAGKFAEVIPWGAAGQALAVQPEIKVPLLVGEAVVGP